MMYAIDVAKNSCQQRIKSVWIWIEKKSFFSFVDFFSVKIFNWIIDARLCNYIGFKISFCVFWLRARWKLFIKPKMNDISTQERKKKRMKFRHRVHRFRHNMLPAFISRRSRYRTMNVPKYVEKKAQWKQSAHVKNSNSTKNHIVELETRKQLTLIFIFLVFY